MTGAEPHRHTDVVVVDEFPAAMVDRCGTTARHQGHARHPPQGGLGMKLLTREWLDRHDLGHLEARPLHRLDATGALDDLSLVGAKLGESYRETNAAFIWATIQRLYAARRTGLKR